MKKITVFENPHNLRQHSFFFSDGKNGELRTELKYMNYRTVNTQQKISFVHKSYSCCLTGVAIEGWDLVYLNSVLLIPSLPPISTKNHHNSSEAGQTPSLSIRSSDEYSVYYSTQSGQTPIAKAMNNWRLSEYSFWSEMSHLTEQHGSRVLQLSLRPWGNYSDQEPRMDWERNLLPLERVWIMGVRGFFF